MIFNPDASEIHRWKYELACEQFKDGIISEAVFSGLLYCLGYRGARLRDEVKYQDGVTVVGEKVSGLPARAW